MKKYIESCDVCQRFNILVKRPQALLKQIVSSRPWQIVGVDFMGPFRLSKSGNRYIIIAVDHFTKFCERFLPKFIGPFTITEILSEVSEWDFTQKSKKQTTKSIASPFATPTVVPTTKLPTATAKSIAVSSVARNVVDPQQTTANQPKRRGRPPKLSVTNEPTHASSLPPKRRGHPPKS